LYFSALEQNKTSYSVHTSAVDEGMGEQSPRKGFTPATRSEIKRIAVALHVLIDANNLLKLICF
jgi:hypothetical protein